MLLSTYLSLCRAYDVDGLNYCVLHISSSQYNMMAVRVPSKFELMRLCKSTNTSIKTLLGVPQPDELGFASSLIVQEIGGTNCIVLKQDASKGNISTIVLRGSTEGFLDDVERAVNDAVNCYKALGKDSRAVAAAGAAEIELARRIAEFGNKQTGLEQYAIIKYAEAFELVPRTLAENSGLNATDVVSALYAAHAQGKTTLGVDIETGEPKDLAQDDIMDLYTAKWWAIKLATEAVTTVLKVDQIIMAKQVRHVNPDFHREPT
jgi:T-complex protein 1 subunit theta